MNHWFKLGIKLSGRKSIRLQRKMYLFFLFHCENMLVSKDTWVEWIFTVKKERKERRFSLQPCTFSITRWKSVLHYLVLCYLLQFWKPLCLTILFLQHRGHQIENTFPTYPAVLIVVKKYSRYSFSCHF